MSGPRIALVDDDSEFLSRMTEILRDFSEREQYPLEIRSFGDAESFLADFRENRYAAVFMDIWMDGLDGLSAARRLRAADSRCLLIFLTSSDEFLQHAFSCHAFEYITKPVAAGRVETVLADMIKILPSRRPFVELRCDRQILRVFLDEIVSAVSEAHYLNICLADGRTLRPRMTIKEFLSLVGEDPRFLTINKGIVVSLDRIVGFEGPSCLLENGSRLPVRVRDRRRIEQTARDYNFSRIRNDQHRRRERGEWTDG